VSPKTWPRKNPNGCCLAFLLPVTFEISQTKESEKTQTFGQHVSFSLYQSLCSYVSKKTLMPQPKPKLNQTPFSFITYNYAYCHS